MSDLFAGRGVWLPLLLSASPPRCPTHPRLEQHLAPPSENRHVPRNAHSMAEKYCHAHCGDEEVEVQGSRVCSFVHSSIHSLTQRFVGEASRE